MLIEIHCVKFKQKSISFHKGLNVVLGDEKASNSIGKTMMLMVLDFAFGGNSFLEHNSDAVKALGDHDYYFVFEFNQSQYIFKRNTSTKEYVHICDLEFEEADMLPLKEYQRLIKSLYKLDEIDLTFRSIVSLFSRIWGKGNLEVKHPLHAHKSQKSSECIDNLIKLYKRYELIESLSKQVKQLEEQRGSLNKAYKHNLIPKINKSGYRENVTLMDEIAEEISDIKERLAIYAINIREVVDREIYELRIAKDELIKERTEKSSRLKRTQSDLSNNKFIKSKTFENLTKFFPSADTQRFAEVEEFHSSISQILKSELKDNEKQLSFQLQEIEDAIARIDNKITKTFSNIDNPAEIIDRVHSLAKKHSSAAREIQYYDQAEETTKDLRTNKSKLREEKAEISSSIAMEINQAISKLVEYVYEENRQPPSLNISDNNYSFSAVVDTGTGKAYSSLLLLDLAILRTTSLPFLIHDSVLFKNIENKAVANLIDVYMSCGKQTFIAIDEIKKYGPDAAGKLERCKVITLSDAEQLYIRDWR